MTEKKLSLGSKRSSYWAWPGPVDLYPGLILAAAWIPVLIFARHSELVLASMLALSICALVALKAVERVWPPRTLWGARTAWGVRIGAAIVGWWLFIAVLARADRFIAFIALAGYAALYVLCDYAAVRRARANGETNQDPATSN